jgi:hypothetical protein
MAQRFRSPAAFRMVKYSNGTETEVLWNSRDGAITRNILSSQTGDELTLTALGERVIDYVPQVGERIIVDLTEQRRQQLSQELVERQERTDMDELRRRFPTREAARLDCLSFLEEHVKSDVLVVTSGYIEELQRSRVQPAGVQVGPIDPETGESADEGPFRYFDRTLKPITVEESMRLLLDDNYRVVLHTRINEHVFVSTIWLGYDPMLLPWESRRPQIFESKAFREREGDEERLRELGSMKYCTEEEAVAGHQKLVDQVSKSDFEEEFVSMFDQLAKRAGINLTAVESIPNRLEMVVMEFNRESTVEDFERKTGMHVTELHVVCPNCGDKHDCASSAQKPHAVPGPGDFATCINCGAIGRYTDEMQLRALVKDDDRDVTREMRFISKKIRKRGRIRSRN